MSDLKDLDEVTVFSIGDNFIMKKLLGITLALLLISGSPIVAGSKGFGGGKGFRPSAPPRSLHQPGPPKTGTIKDLGVNPSSRSPIDSVKNRPGTSPTPMAGPSAPQAAPAPASGFFGSSWFGSSWMNWAILGYLFGRHTGPNPEEIRIKEREKIKAEEAKKKEEAKQAELKTQEQDTTKQQTKETDLKPKEELKNPTKPAAPTDQRTGI